MGSQTGRSAVATAWLATQHQQLMYLLSPEGKTVFYIPGVEVVHTVSTPINLPDEKIKMEAGKMQPPPGGSRKRADAQANITRAREVPDPEPHPGHTNPIGLHIPQISDGGAGDVCQGFRRGPRAPAAV